MPMTHHCPSRMVKSLLPDCTQRALDEAIRQKQSGISQAMDERCSSGHESCPLGLENDSQGAASRHPKHFCPASCRAVIDDRHGARGQHCPGEHLGLAETQIPGRDGRMDQVEAYDPGWPHVFPAERPGAPAQLCENPFWHNDLGERRQKVDVSDPL